MKWFKFLITLLVTVFLVFALNSRIGEIPPLGPLLNPVTGFWQSGDPQPEPGFQWHHKTGMRDSVLVVTDDRLVPHIFARNDHDLYFMQGYMMARDRLWQMDFQTRAAAGRLSEIIGEDAVEYDLYQRRLGMVYGAENKLREYEQNEEAMDVFWAFNNGINTYIDELKPRTYPLEFKLLGYEPEKWNPLKSLLMQMNMASTLASGSSSFQLTNTKARFGADFVDKMFPHYPQWMDPIVPGDTDWDFDPVTVDRPALDFIPSVISQLLLPEHDPTIGSNSWAVHGSRTATGSPLLANDMHLQMTLPAIWYENQLHAPGINVYGVSIPGLPGVIVGFNEDISWGFTNSGANVLDIFEIEFQDETRSHYLHDGEWKPTDYRIETVLVKGAEAVIDTVYYTHHGPVPFHETPTGLGRQFPGGHAIQWIAHQPSLDMMTFSRLNRASGYEEFLEAIPNFDSPAQNFTYADRHGTVALWHNGKFPVRWHGMGDFISDGRDPAYDWNEFVPREHLPHYKNPERGFISSANQHPVSPDYPYYLGRFFAPYERGARINQVLESLDEATPEDMMLLQLDNISLHAEKAIPLMLSYVIGDSDGLVKPEMLDVLNDWNYSMEADKIAPTLYQHWWTEFQKLVWDDLYGNSDNGPPLRRPSRDRLLELMMDEPESYIFSRTAGNQTRGLESLIRDGWNNAIENIRNREPDTERWEWWRFNNVNVSHLADIEPFSHRRIHTSGTSEAVNATRGSHGPSWRMVVSLEDEVQAWGVYPGGQSGAPGSKHYDDFIAPFARGGFFRLNFFKSSDDAIEFVQSKSQTPEVSP